jgi:hypothetical protein
MDARAAIAAFGVAVNPLDVVDEFTVGGGLRALRARPLPIIASKRNAEHVAHDRHRLARRSSMKRNLISELPAKIAIDLFKMSRSMRSRSFSRCKRAISAAWSADGSLACVVGRRDAAVGSHLAPLPPPQHGIAQAKFLGHRSDRAATRCDQINRLPLVVVRKRPTVTYFHPTPPGSSSPLQVSISSEDVQD